MSALQEFDRKKEKDRAVFLLHISVEELETKKQLLAKGIPVSREDLNTMIETLDRVILKLAKE